MSSVRVSLSALQAVPREGADWDTAERIKAQLAALRGERDPFYLTLSDLGPILTYKLRRQEARGAKHRELLTDEMVRSLTAAAFAVALADKDTEARLRVTILSAMPGIGMGVASTVLALAEPASYAVIDFRGWRALFGEERKTFTARQYNTYLRGVRELATQLSWQPQVVDWCLWNLGAEGLTDPGPDAD